MWVYEYKWNMCMRNVGAGLQLEGGPGRSPVTVGELRERKREKERERERERLRQASVSIVAVLCSIKPQAPHLFVF